MSRLTEAIFSVMTKLVRSSPFSADGSTRTRVGTLALSYVVNKHKTTDSKTANLIALNNDH